MPTKKEYYVDESHPWHPSNSKKKKNNDKQNTTEEISCSIETSNPKKRQIEDFVEVHNVDSGVISFESKVGGEERGVQQGPSRKIVRTMDYVNDKEDDEHIDSSFDEVCTHRIHDDGDDDDDNDDNNDHEVVDDDDDNNFEKTVQTQKRATGKYFDERFKELEAFKAKHGHCNVPNTKKKDGEYHTLGHWCNRIRQSYKGNISKRTKLTPSNIKALQDIGFELKSKTQKSFDERLKELEAFKAKHGHCRVPNTRKKDCEYYTLGNWCCKVRQTYKGNISDCKLTPSNIKALQDIGFRF